MEMEQEEEEEEKLGRRRGIDGAAVGGGAEVEEEEEASRGRHGTSGAVGGQRGLTLRRIVRWSQLRWRAVVEELLAPIRKAVMEMAAARQLVGAPQVSFPFFCPFPLPLV
uniref:Uncharacterized protein n=1 Tax=Ananas comosus var. bracteatus TaxID=296719 RepID=A0A6V7Q7F6_ANACO|nr:unnamed protein product [Ananas comosus var. bracteatus]